MKQDYMVFNEAIRFCARCGGTLESRLLKATEPERLVCARCSFVHYIDPKVAIIADEQGRIVLVKRAIEPGYGKWVFPGGFIDRGETVEAAALREAREECGLDIRLDRLTLGTSPLCGCGRISTRGPRPACRVTLDSSASQSGADR